MVRGLGPGERHCATTSTRSTWLTMKRCDIWLARTLLLSNDPFPGCGAKLDVTLVNEMHGSSAGTAKAPKATRTMVEISVQLLGRKSYAI